MKKLLSLSLAILMIVSLGAVAFGASDSMSADRNEAIRAFDLINKEREKAGKEPLVWVEELYEPAVTRSKELYQNFSHTRPDGSKWNTVSSWAKGENISWNRTSAAGVVDQWMNSPGHKDNIMGAKYDFVGMAVARVDSPKGPYWTLLLSLKLPEGTDTTKKEIVTGSPVHKVPGGPAVSVGTPAGGRYTGKGIAAALNDANKGKGMASIRETADKTLTADVTKELRAWETTTKRMARIHFDTNFSDNKGVQGRLTYYPERFANQTKDMTCGVYLEGKTVDAVADRFDKWFANDVVIVALDNPQPLEGVADLAVKADLTALDTGNLIFYTYDVATNKYALQENTQYVVDRMGFLHFATQGNCIIITDKELVRK